MGIGGLRVVDIFSGGGGLSQGFLNAGFDIVAAFDNWKSAITFYKNNFTHPIKECDLGNVTNAVNAIKVFAPTAIVGGPPCQDFSSAGKRNEKGGRASLTVSFAQIVMQLRPRYFVMENVDRAVKSESFATAVEMLSAAGYGITNRILDASYCGVPQIRKRVFVVGEIGGEDGFLDALLEENLAEKRLTIREHLGDKVGAEYYYRHPRSYQRRAIFSIDEPSPTVRGVNRPLPKGYPGHPGDKAELTENLRALTTRERALIQTFPEHFDLEGSKTDIEQIIGNAVPIKLAEFVANALAKHIEAVEASMSKAA